MNKSHFETSRNAHPATQRRIPEDSSPLQTRCENLQNAPVNFSFHWTGTKCLLNHSNNRHWRTGLLTPLGICVTSAQVCTLTY